MVVVLQMRSRQSHHVVYNMRILSHVAAAHGSTEYPTRGRDCHRPVTCVLSNSLPPIVPEEDPLSASFAESALVQWLVRGVEEVANRKRVGSAPCVLLTDVHSPQQNV